MNRSIEKTLGFLTQTANEAAIPVLLAALDSPDLATQQGALYAILARRRGAGPRALVERWHQLQEPWKRLIVEQPRLISPAIRRAVLSADDTLCANGCEALLHTREYELIPALVTGIEEPQNPQASRVARTMIQLCELLEEDISGPRDRLPAQDPTRTRQSVLPSIERAVDRYEQHRCREVVEAFLMLTHRDNPLLQRILGEPRHPVYLVLLDVLTNSRRRSVIRLVLNLLESRPAPSVVVQLVSHRSDAPFVTALLKRVAGPAWADLQPTMRRIHSIAWLEEDTRLLNTLSGPQQALAIQVLAASGIHRLKAFEPLKHVLQQGHVEGRRAAATALAEFGGAEANQLALDGLQDPDPQVRANLVVQLRERGIPGAISRLIRLLDSEDDVVRRAAQSCLTEFTFNRYITLFDMMEPDVRRSTGMLVMRIDPTAPEQLAQELRAKSRTRRVRALEAATTLGAVPLVEPLVIGLLQDPDHFLRAEAARALAHCTSPLAQQSLREALLDRSTAVREAAEEALRKISHETRDTAPVRLTTLLQRVEENPLVQPPSANASPS
jgi:HEAT repeat protein